MEKLQIAFLLFILSLTLGCKNISNFYTNDSPDEIIVYKLPQYNKYFVDVKCEELKNRNGVTKIILNKKNDIRKFNEIFNNSENFKVDNSYSSIDSRIQFEIKKNGKILKTICWSNTKLIEVEGRVYRCLPIIDIYLMNTFGVIVIGPIN